MTSSWKSYKLFADNWVDVLNKHGSIWVGRPKKSVVKSKLQTQLPNLINGLINYTQHLAYWQSVEKIPTLDTQLELIHEAQKIDHWQWPGIIIKNNEWWTGNTRLLASAFRWQNPEDHFCMISVFNDTAPLDLADPELITNQQGLLQYFDWLKIDNQDDFFVDINLQEQCLHFKRNQNLQHGPHCGFLYRYLQWAQRNQFPKIEIFTDWPELIKDSSNHWTVEFAGASPYVLKDCPGVIDRHTWMHEWKSGIDHVMYVGSPKPIDLAYLLPWFELDYKQYADTDWSFTVGYRYGKTQTKIITMFDFDNLYFY